MNKRRIGAEYEKIVCDALDRRGVTVVETNYRNRFGEIDIIAKDGEYLCFIEVKYRSGTGCGDPAEAVDLRKQRTIRKVAEGYLFERNIGEWTYCRFDVAAVMDGQIRWVKNAF